MTINFVRLGNVVLSTPIILADLSCTEPERKRCRDRDLMVQLMRNNETVFSDFAAFQPRAIA